MPSTDIVAFVASYFGNLTDPRLSRTKRHELLDLIIRPRCGALANADG